MTTYTLPEQPPLYSHVTDKDGDMYVLGHENGGQMTAWTAEVEVSLEVIFQVGQDSPDLTHTILGVLAAKIGAMADIKDWRALAPDITLHWVDDSHPADEVEAAAIADRHNRQVKLVRGTWRVELPATPVVVKVHPFQVDLRKHRIWGAQQAVNQHMLADVARTMERTKEHLADILSRDVARRLLLTIDPVDIRYDNRYDMMINSTVFTARWLENWPPWA
jgi:hypothetical protein